MTVSRKIGRGMTNILQENFEMITGSMQVGEISTSTTIEYYQKDLSESDQGYQRPLNSRRIQSMANSFERDIKNGNFLPIPTAIILSDRGVNYKTSNGEIDLIDGEFKIIDGQHRSKSFSEVVTKFKDELPNFSTNHLPVVIIKIEDPNKTENEKKDLEMKIFKTINETAKRVPVDLALHLLTWRKDTFGSGLANTVTEENRIICNKVVNRLNDRCKTWKDVILMPADDKYSRADINSNEILAHKRIVKSTSLVNSLKPVLNMVNEKYWNIEGQATPSFDGKVDFIYGISKNFWDAIDERMPDISLNAKEYVLHKSTGSFSMHHLLSLLVEYMLEKNMNLKKKDFLKLLNKDLKFLTSEFWVSNIVFSEKSRKGEATKYGNMAGFKQLGKVMFQEIKPQALSDEDMASLV